MAGKVQEIRIVEEYEELAELPRHPVAVDEEEADGLFLAATRITTVCTRVYVTVRGFTLTECTSSRGSNLLLLPSTTS